MPAWLSRVGTSPPGSEIAGADICKECIVHKVIENPRKHRFEIMVDGEPAGYAEYRSAPGVRAFVHTVVEERFRGRGLAAELIARALDATREQGLAVEPYCPYVRSYIAKHPDYFDLVPEDRRTQFGLPSSPSTRKSA